jgi:methylated-DNA-[protein]-cysteine S-methyltransferase
MIVRMWTVVESPVGRLRLVAHDGALTGVDFLDDYDTLAGADFLDDVPALPQDAAVAARYADRAARRPPGERDDDDPLLREVAEQLKAYFALERESFDVPLAPVGTAFQLRVWELLRQIPYGTTAGYGELAGRLGLTGHGARAVGLANGRNPIAIVVPCHRVVGADGRLVGYGGGVARKRYLLDLEQGALF